MYLSIQTVYQLPVSATIDAASLLASCLCFEKSIDSTSRRHCDDSIHIKHSTGLTLNIGDRGRIASMPHFRYAGHKHQYKYQCGHTFGATTNRLLRSARPSDREPDLLRRIDPPRSHTVALGFHDVPKVSHFLSNAFLVSYIIVDCCRYIKIDELIHYHAMTRYKEF